MHCDAGARAGRRTVLLLADAVGYRPVIVDPVGSAAFAQTLLSLSVGLLNVGTYTTAAAPVPAYARRYAG